VLLGPQRNERFRDPDAQGGQAVEACVAGGADGNQKLALMDTGLTMMHMEAMPRPAGLTDAAVALQNVVAEAGEALAGAGGGVVAGAAEAGDKGKIPATGTEQGPLERKTADSGRRGQERLYSRIAFAKKYYHRRLAFLRLAWRNHSAYLCANIHEAETIPFLHA
jgi:hypothetical protein